MHLALMLKSAFDEIISGYNVKWIVHPGDSYKDKSVGHFQWYQSPSQSHRLLQIPDV